MQLEQEHPKILVEAYVTHTQEITYTTSNMLGATLYCYEKWLWFSLEWIIPAVIVENLWSPSRLPEILKLKKDYRKQGDVVAAMWFTGNYGKLNEEALKPKWKTSLTIHCSPKRPDSATV